MFRFWSTDSRGSEKTVDTCQDLSDPHLPTPGATPTTNGAPSPRGPRRRRDSSDDDLSNAADIDLPAVKRARQDVTGAIGLSSCADENSHDFPVTSDMERAHDAIQYQFGLEILFKHDELRLINQELAKCQVALEQLRRCHLIPYPISCPTPEQMLDISSGKGPALQSRAGEPLPRWAAPFGVVDGPYARHYAKWLIPDPKFDGVQPEWPAMPEFTRSRTSLEGRTTRNSIVDLGGIGAKRNSRGVSGQKLQALSSGYLPPKDKAGPCVLKRADGLTVKLVCIDCHRENFSSTQGFINHCRIAHRRDFKSHEEAAVACGHAIEVDESGGVVGGEDKSAASACVAPGLVHPFARTDMTEQQAYRSLQSRIQESLRLFHQGKLPGISRIPASVPKAAHAQPKPEPARSFSGSADTPYLSRLMQSRKFDGNLAELVAEAKSQDLFEDVWSPGEESEEPDASHDLVNGVVPAPTGARAPVVMRIPARTTMSPAPTAPMPRPASSKGRSPHLPFSSLPPMADGPTVMMLHDEDVDMDVDLSPNTLVSNNAPSLVSDDSDYDSDDASSQSEADDSLDAESVSDVAEITIDEDQEPSRPMRHHREQSGIGSGTAMRLKKDDNKHVTLVSPVKNTNATKERRVRKL